MNSKAGMAAPAIFADSCLLSRKVAPHRLCCFASPAYLAARGTPMHPDDLEGTTSSTSDIRAQVKAFAGLPDWRPRDRDGAHRRRGLDVSDAVVAVLAAGGGIGSIASFIAAPYVAHGELAPVLSAFAVEWHVITALWPESRRANPAVRAFRTLLQNLFQERIRRGRG
ncbi:LysR substrate-binding domain-containing protein [Mesorhizobium sp. M0909]